MTESMTQKTKQTNPTVKKHWSNSLLFATQAIMFALFAATFIAAIHPEARTGLRSTLLKDYRSLVSTAKADLTGTGTEYTVVKVKTRDSIFLEIYRPETRAGMKLVEKIQLADVSDGYFSFNGRATNLALEDIDGDGRAEILAPSFDRDLVGRLNIFKFNEGSRGFDRVVR